MTRTPARSTRRAIGVIAVLVLTAAGCSSGPGPSTPGGASPSPTPSPSPSPAPTTIATPDDAAARVLALEPRFAGLRPKDPNAIGVCCFYTASEAIGGFSVAIEVGWGDCPAGCINRHHWTYAV